MDDGYYLLENRQVVRCRNQMDWLQRRLALPENWHVIAETVVGSVRVSTVFLLGLNHAYSADSTPVLFETLTFGDGVLDEIQVRYHSLEDAERGHNQIVQELRDAEKELDKLYARANE